MIVKREMKGQESGRECKQTKCVPPSQVQTNFLALGSMAWPAYKEAGTSIVKQAQSTLDSSQASVRLLGNSANPGYPPK